MFLVGIILIIYLALIVLCIVGLWKVFVKAGYQGWEAIIPGYNLYILTKIAQRPVSHFWITITSYVVVMVSSFLIEDFAYDYEYSPPTSTEIVGLVLYFIGAIVGLIYLAKIHKSVAINFGRDIWYAIGLLFLPFIFWPILGFGNDQYLPGRQLDFEIDSIGTNNQLS